MKNLNYKTYNVIDLFAGAGGFSEGFYQTKKFHFLAHVEWEQPMIETLRANLVSRWGFTEEKALIKTIHFDIQKVDQLLKGISKTSEHSVYYKTNSLEFINNGLDGIVDGIKVDIIIGGPPCQSYSIAGRAQDPHSMKLDYRNYLFESFVKIVDHFKPDLFVFENVPGILSAKPGDELVINRIYRAFNEIGYEIRDPQNISKSVYTSSHFEVPQDRNRVIIFGVNKTSKLNLEELYQSLDSLRVLEPLLNVKDAISHLPKLLPLNDIANVEGGKISHYQPDGEIIKYHYPRYHNNRDIKVFERWILEGMNKVKTADKLDFYEKVTGKRSNHNKYRNLEWDKPSPTIVAHLYKDGLMFIHPDVEQRRSITVKEASLIQSFPDDYIFIGSNAYCFKMIGNAVPVKFANKIANAIVNYLESIN
jgi:DNA (cytosine-5)-methyltransferase 1